MPVPLYIMNDDGELVPWDGKVEAAEGLRAEPRKIAVDWAQVVVMLLLLAILVSLWVR